MNDLTVDYLSVGDKILGSDPHHVYLVTEVHERVVMVSWVEDGYHHTGMVFAEDLPRYYVEADAGYL